MFILPKSSSTFTILACNLVLSNTCFSTTSSSLLFSLTALGELFRGVSVSNCPSSFFGMVFSTFSTFSTLTSFSSFPPSLLALATPVPKKILAPITTEAAPTLNFLIEKLSFFSPSLNFLKYILFFPIKLIPPNNLFYKNKNYI